MSFSSILILFLTIVTITATLSAFYFNEGKIKKAAIFAALFVFLIISFNEYCNYLLIEKYNFCKKNSDSIREFNYCINGSNLIKGGFKNE